MRSSRVVRLEDKRLVTRQALARRVVLDRDLKLVTVSVAVTPGGGASRRWIDQRGSSGCRPVGHSSTVNYTCALRDVIGGVGRETRT